VEGGRSHGGGVPRGTGWDSGEKEGGKRKKGGGAEPLDRREEEGKEVKGAHSEEIAAKGTEGIEGRGGGGENQSKNIRRENEKGFGKKRATLQMRTGRRKMVVQTAKKTARKREGKKATRRLNKLKKRVK